MHIESNTADVESETEAPHRFIADVVATEDAIVECTGMGTLGRDLSAALNGQNNGSGRTSLQQAGADRFTLELDLEGRWLRSSTTPRMPHSPSWF